MSISSIKKLNSNQLFELHKLVVDEYHKKQQKELDDELYPVKNKTDSLKCTLCGGFYTRRNRYIHNNTKKHNNKLNEIYELAAQVFE